MGHKNFIFKDPREKEREGHETVQSLIIECCKKCLGPGITDVKRAYRVGPRRERYNHALVVGSSSYRTKREVKGNAFRIKILQSNKASSEQDFSRRMQFNRKKLGVFKREERGPNEKTSYCNSLVLGNTRYRYDDVNGRVCAIIS